MCWLIVHDIIFCWRFLRYMDIKYVIMKIPLGAHCRQSVESTETGLKRKAIDEDSLLSYNT